MEWRDISSFDQGWDFSTDLYRAPSLGQPIDTSALGSNKLEFAKMQGYGFRTLINFIMLLCVLTSFNKGLIPIPPFNTSFSDFLLCLPTSMQLMQTFYLFRKCIIFLLCVFRHNIIALETCFAFWWSGLHSKASQSCSNAHILQDWENQRMHIQTHSSSLSCSHEHSDE